MATATSSKLFEPIKVGKTLLRHRVVMAPMTRQRATEAHVPTELMAEYYAQRASAPGTLLISEGTFVSEKAVGGPRAPGIWSREQIEGWKKVTDAVHAKGSFICLQIGASGRSARPDFLASRGLPYTGVSPIQHPWHTVPPRPLTLSEISDYIAAFGTAASNAVDLAGFDAVEIHGANGFLVDQFLQTNTNAREDAYGGSVENRIRFADEVVDAVVNAVGAERTGIRLSPWSTFQAMGMPDPIPTFEALVRRIDSKHPDLGWIHVVEPDRDPEPAPSANSGAATNADVVPPSIERSNAFVDAIRLPRPVIHSNGYTLASALAATTSSSSDPASNRDGVLIGFGRAFLANPDLPSRLRSQANAVANGELDGGVEMNVPDPETFYAGEEVGYVDYPFAPQRQKAPVSNIVLTGAQAALLSVKA